MLKLFSIDFTKIKLFQRTQVTFHSIDGIQVNNIGLAGKGHAPDKDETRGVGATGTARHAMQAK